MKNVLSPCLARPGFSVVVCFMTCLVHSVFWDLYCAAPERRETCDHSSEAKAFHDYVSSSCMETVALMKKTTNRLSTLTWSVNKVPLTWDFCNESDFFPRGSYHSKVLAISVCEHSRPDRISHIPLQDRCSFRLLRFLLARIMITIYANVCLILVLEVCLISMLPTAHLELY